MGFQAILQDLAGRIYFLNPCQKQPFVSISLGKGFLAILSTWLGTAISVNLARSSHFREPR